MPLLGHMGWHNYDLTELNSVKPYFLTLKPLLNLSKKKELNFQEFRALSIPKSHHRRTRQAGWGVNKENIPKNWLIEMLLLLSNINQKNETVVVLHYNI